MSLSNSGLGIPLILAWVPVWNNQGDYTAGNRLTRPARVDFRERTRVDFFEARTFS
jgi:hypothetical protein